MKRYFALTALLFLLLTAACTATPQSNQAQVSANLNAQPQSAIIESQPQPAADPTQQVLADQAATVNQIIPAPGQYPTTPEGVVQAFLSAYQLDPPGMNQYLDATQAAYLQGGDAAALLLLGSALDSFVIDAGAVNPQALEAFVSVAIQSGGAETRRNIYLGQENGQWKIGRIEIATEAMQPPQS